MVAIKHHLMDLAKSTDVGKRRRRFVNVLGYDERFIRSTEAGEAWALAGFDGQVWSGDLAVLLLVRGENDPRCPVTEDAQLVTALCERGIPHRYIVVPAR